MKHLRLSLIFFWVIVVVLLAGRAENLHAQCDPGVPSFIVDLSTNPDSVWEISSSRSDYCCDASGTDRCIEFIVTLHPAVNGIFLDVKNPAPPGAMYFIIGCDSSTITQVGEIACVDGPGPHVVTFCKPGNDSPTYTIAGIGKAEISDPITVTDACVDTLYAIGFKDSTITWASVPSDSLYDSYLSCTSGCDTAIVTPSGAFPDSVQYEVCGEVAGMDCGSSSIVCDTVTVYFANSLEVAITPENPAICFGGAGVTLTANGSGGASPYSYLWSTGETTQNITASSGGEYWVELQDTLKCVGVRDTVMVLEFTANITADAGPDDTICTDNPVANLNGTVTGVTTGIWSGGDGIYTPSDEDLNAAYEPSAAEVTAGSVTLQLLTTNTGTCPPDSDLVVISILPPPEANAGADTVICEDAGSVNVNGSVITASGGTWSTSGSGSFADPNALSTTYTPSAADISAGSVELMLTTTGNANCSPDTDTLLLTITPAPTANAGPDETICADADSVSLSGSVTTATGGAWTSSGTGSFSDPNAVNTYYHPSEDDTTAGTVTLTLTTTGNGGCNAVSDDMVLTITPAPTVDAGPDQLICADAGTVSLSGTVTTATGGTWSSSGTGSFADPNDLNTTYAPSNADTTAGTVTLTLTTTGNGGCNAVTDDMVLTITPAPTVDAGSDQIICADVASIILNGTVTTATGGTWTTSGTGNFTDPNDLNTSYAPSDSDTAAGTITLTLTSTGNGGCNAVSDEMILTITPAPTADAGSDQTICADAGTVSLNGSVTTATGGTWTTSGTGSFTDPSDLNTSYTPSDTDTATGTITLTLTTTGNGSCNAVSDEMILTITPAPTVDAGTDQMVCASTSAVAVSGQITTAAGGIWTTNGSGSFSDANSLSTDYIPDPADITAGSIFLILTTTGNGGCNAVSDTLLLTFEPEPLAFAGPDTVVCANATSFFLNGNIGNATGGIWNTTGAGSFSPDATTLNAEYFPTAGDISGGSISFTLSTSGTVVCPPDTDQKIVEFEPLPEAFAGNDTAICNDETVLQLNGVINNASGGTWTSLGTGTFSPDDSTLNAQYNITPADISSGLITLVLTSNDGCVIVSDTMDVVITPFVNAGNDTIVCSGTSSVQLDGFFSNAGGAEWTTSGSGTFSPDANTLNAVYNLSAGDIAAGAVTLSLTSTGNGSCPAMVDSIIITILPPPVVSIVQDTTICNHDVSVDFSATISDADGGVWSSSGNGYFLPDDSSLTTTYVLDSSDLVMDTIWISMVSYGGCIPDTGSIYVAITDAPVADAGPDQSVCATSPDALLDGNVFNAGGGIWSSSGTGTFSPDETTLNATYSGSNADTAAGSIILTLTTTGNGICNAHTDTMILSFTPDAITVNAGNDSIVCAMDIQLDGTVNVATGGVWSSLGSGTFSPSDSLLAPVYEFSSGDTTAGSVTLVLTTTGNGGCAAKSDTVLVSIETPITVNIIASDTVCNNVPLIPLDVNVSTAAGQWSTLGDGSFTPYDTILDPSYVPGSGDTAQGDVTLIFTSANNSACAAVNDTFRIVFLPSPDAVFSATEVCPGDTTFFTENSTGMGGIVSWSWDFDDGNTDTLQTPSHLYGSDSTYNVMLTVTSGYGCTDTVTEPVIVHAFPVADFTSTAQCFVDSVYFNDITTINSDSLSTWQWSFGDGDSSFVQHPGHAYSGPGVYTVTQVVVSSFGCSDTTVQTLTVQPSPKAVFNASSICFGDTTVFTDSSFVTTGSVTSWEWDFGDGSPGSSLQHPTHLFTQDTIYNVQLIVVSDNGCTDTLVQQVEIHPLPVAAFTSNSECFVEVVEFTDLSTISKGVIMYWEWDFGDGNGDNLPNPAHAYAVPGTYTVSLVVGSDQGCLDTTDQTIGMEPAPNAAFGNTIACSYGITSFTDSSSIQLGAIISWNWDFGDGGSSNEQHPDHIYTSDSIYEVTLTVMGTNGCSDTITKEVATYPLPQVQFEADGNCLADGMQFSDQSIISEGNINSWQWYFGDGGSSEQQHPFYFYDSEGVYPVSLIAGSSEGCKDTLTLATEINPSPNAGFTPSPVIAPILADVTFNDNSSGAHFWQWDFGDGSVASASSPVHAYADGGIYMVMQVVGNDMGCVDTAYQQVIITLPPDVPSGFTPNGDLVNDVLHVMGGPYKELEFRIYNNWGELIFVSNRQEDGWDGTRNGIAQPVGVYVYTVVAVTLDNIKHNTHGDVTLLR